MCARRCALHVGRRLASPSAVRLVFLFVFWCGESYLVARTHYRTGATDLSGGEVIRSQRLGQWCDNRQLTQLCEMNDESAKCNGQGTSGCCGWMLCRKINTT